MITIDATVRDVKVNPKLIRKQGKLPAVFYGSGQESTPITVDKIQFGKAWQEAGESTIISLQTPKGKLDALIHDVALHPVYDEPVHVDFYVVAKDHKIEVDIPLEFIGVAPAEKLGGIVLKVIHELTIESLPGKLPQQIIVDLGLLTGLDSHISVADLKLGDGVRALVPGTEVVASISLPQEETEGATAPLDLSAIEVEKKGKKEEDGAESAE
jgi:large subunit ribosomal protein L25